MIASMIGPPRKNHTQSAEICKCYFDTVTNYQRAQPEVYPIPADFQVENFQFFRLESSRLSFCVRVHAPHLLTNGILQGWSSYSSNSLRELHFAALSIRSWRLSAVLRDLIFSSRDSVIMPKRPLKTCRSVFDKHVISISLSLLF